MIDDSEKPNHQLGFERHSSHDVERRNKEVANGKTLDLHEGESDKNTFNHCNVFKI